MAVLTRTAADNIITLDPAAASTRAFYANRRKPFINGYELRADYAATSILAGFNHPGNLNNSKVVSLQGAGAANGGSAFAYALPTGTGVVLPTTADITACTNYLNAVMIAFARFTPTSVTVVPRIATGGADPASGAFWRVTDAGNISTAAGVSGGVYTDWATNYVLRIFVPAAADITTIFDIATAGQAGIKSYDFMAAGATAKAGVVRLSRVFG